MEDVFLALRTMHYQTVKKRGCFYTASALGCLKSERVGDLLPQKAAEGQHLAGLITRFDVSTDKFM